MNPWTVIGWLILAAVAFKAGARIIPAIIASCVRLCLYLKTRNIPPATGQVWDQDGALLRVRVAPAGHVVVIAGNASWGESLEDWRERVRNRRLFLVRSERT
jgi:hypothetical protein